MGARELLKGTEEKIGRVDCREALGQKGALPFIHAPIKSFEDCSKKKTNSTVS